MKPQTAIAKGKILEEWIVNRLRLSKIDTRAYRQKGSGSGLNKGDIWNDLNLCIEAKNQKNFKNAWAKQVKRESLGVQIPVIVWHPPQVPLEDSVVMIDWPFFEELLKHWKEPTMKEPDRETAWTIKSAINILKKLLKELEK